MSSDRPTPGPEEARESGGELVGVYRTLPARILGWLMVASSATVGFIVIRDQLALGRDVFLSSALVLLVVAVVYVLLLRPRVELRSESVTQRNILRDVTVPFARLSEVGHQWSLELTDATGRTYSSWAIPKQREFSMRRATDDFGDTTARRRGRPGTTAQVVAGDVQRELQRWSLDAGQPRQDAPVQQQWALAAVLPFAGSIALLVLAIVLDA